MTYVLAGAAVAFLLGWFTWRRNRAQNVWGDAAGLLGTMSIRFDQGLQTLGGVLDGVSVRVSVDGAGGGRHTRIAATTDVPEGFAFRRREAPVSSSHDVTGDAAFDQAVALEGPRVAGMAILDAPLRRRIAEAVALGVRLEHSELVVRRPGVIGDGETLANIVRVVAELARRLADAHRADRVERLVNVATRDPESGVRVHALRILIDHYSDDPAARSALDRSLVDAAAEVRMMGASGVGPSGFEAMRSIANDATLPAAARASALDKLVTLFPRSQSAPALTKALDDQTTAARKIAIIALGKMRHAPALSRLVSLAGRAVEPEEQAALAQALGRLGDPSAENALLGLLDAEDSSVRTASALALGRIGGRKSVAPLTPLAASVMGGELKKAAADAIDKIQARLARAGGAEGQLTMSDPDSEEGQVSLPVQDGALDLADPPVPPRKLPQSS